MIYGYDLKQVNSYGLKEMREICITATPALLRQIAKHLTDAAMELEEDWQTVNWHRHLPESVASQLGCDIVVANDV